MLTQLQLAGILGRARALVFGEMRGCAEQGGAVTALDVITRLTRGCPGPVIVGFPSGHTTGPTWTLPLGVAIRVSTRPRPAILVEESPVE
jgi:muramoyltetrapeptide carboxypeptidase LdcA involved in peptidoglycan recycling